MKECTNCGSMVDNLRKSRCDACYTYLRRKGVDRPRDVVERHAYRTAPVTNGRWMVTKVHHHGKRRGVLR